MDKKEQLSEKELEKVALKKSFEDFYTKTGKNAINSQDEAKPAYVPPSMNFNSNDFMHQQMKETDPDLIIDADIVKLPSEGYFYPIKEVTVEYLTAKDEDILTTPALMENGTVLDEILKRKIKTKGLDVENMLTGDKNAILIFLRASSYGAKYDVEVTNPKTGKPFKYTIDLTKIGYKKVAEHPDENGLFTVELPIRKKIAKFRLLGDREIKQIIDKAELLKETYNQVFAETSTMRLKAAVVSIDGNMSKDYIVRFIDSMPAGDALAIRSKMEKVTPGVDLTYEFVSPEGHLFRAPLAMGIDFFPKSLAGEYKKMIMEETYLLTKHGRFSAEYIEKIPVFKRRYFLNLMKEEADEVRKEQEKSHTHVNRVSGVRRR